MKRILTILTITAATAGLAGTAFAEAAGDAIYAKKCASCHGKDGKGDTTMGKKLKVQDLTAPAVKSKLTQASVEKTTTDGIPEKKMPAFKGKLSPEEIKAVSTYILGLK